jgi:hypothetical protein
LTALFWIFIIGFITFLLISSLISTINHPPDNLITLDILARHIQNGNVDGIIVEGGQTIVIEMKDGEEFSAHKERETNLFQMLQFYGVSNENLQSFSYEERPVINIRVELIIGIILVCFAAISGFFWQWSRQYQDFVRKEIASIINR